MVEHAGTESARPYNVVAAFPSEGAATTAVERLTNAGIPSAAIALHRPGETGPDETAELRGEMQDELDEAWVGPAGLAMTATQAKGAFFGTVLAGGIGGLIGALAGLLWASAADSSLGRPGRVILCVGLGILGGATVGFLAGGIRKPRKQAAEDPRRPGDDQRLAGERDHLIAVHSDQRALVERAATILRDSGAERVHLVDATQTPLPPQAAHPRPADPTGWWWRRAGHG
jgi:hypothetical protein